MNLNLEWIKAAGAVLSAVIALLGTLGICRTVAGGSRVRNGLLILYALGGLWLVQIRGVQIQGLGPAMHRAVLWSVVATFVGAGLAALGGLKNPTAYTKSADGVRLRDYAVQRLDCEVRGERYIDWAHGFEIQHLNDWLLQDVDPTFRSMGGFLAVESPDGAAALNVSSGGWSPAVATDWEEYARRTFDESRVQQGGGPMRCVALKPLQCNSQFLRLEFDATQRGRRARIGKVTTINSGNEYVAYYQVFDGPSVDIDQVLASWAWPVRCPVASEANREIVNVTPSATGSLSSAEAVVPKAHDFKAIQRLFESAKARVEHYAGGHPVDYFNLDLKAGEAACRNELLKTAEQELNQVIAWCRTNEMPILTANALTELGMLYALQGRNNQARDRLSDADSVWKTTPNIDQGILRAKSAGHYHLGCLSFQDSMLAEAEIWFRKALMEAEGCNAVKSVVLCRKGLDRVRTRRTAP